MGTYIPPSTSKLFDCWSQVGQKDVKLPKGRVWHLTIGSEGRLFLLVNVFPLLCHFQCLFSTYTWLLQCHVACLRWYDFKDF